MEIRVIVKGVKFVGAGTTWRHLIGCQAPYQSCVVFWFTKNVVFHIFTEQEAPGAGFVPPGARLLILGARRHRFSSSLNFHKNAFLGSLTVWFRWNFDRWSRTCSSSLRTVEIWFGCQQLELYVTQYCWFWSR